MFHCKSPNLVGKPNQHHRTTIPKIWGQRHRLTLERWPDHEVFYTGCNWAEWTSEMKDYYFKYFTSTNLDVSATYFLLDDVPTKNVICRKRNCILVKRFSTLLQFDNLRPFDTARIILCTPSTPSTCQLSRIPSSYAKQIPGIHLLNVSFPHPIVVRLKPLKTE